MWQELGISSGTALIILIALYFVIKWAVRNGIREALFENQHQKSFSEAYAELNTLKNDIKDNF